MSTSLKTLLGVLSILGFLFIPVIIGYMFLAFIPEMIAMDQQGIDPSPGQIFPILGGFMIISMLFALISFGLMIFYIIHVVQDSSATSNDRILWIILLIFFSNFVLPFYWYFRIWKTNEKGNESILDS